MYNVKLYDYIPAPEPVTSDYIIAAHYYPAWKVGAAQVHKGFPMIAEYPERTPLLGYYDEENPEVTDWEIKWATEHGVNCFIYCWYRYKENMHHPVTVDALRCGHGIHEGLFHAKFGSKIKFAIMFEGQGRWCNTDPEDFKQYLFPFWMETYFTRENYLVIDNKPVVYFYDWQNCIRDGFGSAEAQQECFAWANDYAKKFGFDGVTFQIEYRLPDLNRFDEYKAHGYDSTFTYCWNTKKKHPSQEEIIADQMEAMFLRAAKDPYYFIPCASKQWDPRPRAGVLKEYGKIEDMTVWLLTPGNWRKLLEKIKGLMDSLPADSLASKMLILDNWNEWDEGHYLSPHYEGGFQYLQAVREVFTKRDNLPDYRDPAFLGFERLDKGWGKQDLSQYCTKKLD